eukprot:4426831-Lingulodinium_polyedra.AAC.1
MGERGPASARPTRGACALARACAAFAGGAPGQEPSISWHAATSLQGAAAPAPGSAYRLAPGMHQLWGARRVSPAGQLSSLRRIAGNAAASGRALIHGGRTLGGLVLGLRTASQHGSFRQLPAS